MAVNLSRNPLEMNETYTTRSLLITTSAVEDKVVSLENRPIIMVTFISLYALIFFFGITGNALVVCKCLYSSALSLSSYATVYFLDVVCRNKAMQTVTNVFITNLALSDILV